MKWHPRLQEVLHITMNELRHFMYAASALLCCLHVYIHSGTFHNYIGAFLATETTLQKTENDGNALGYFNTLFKTVSLVY